MHLGNQLQDIPVQFELVKLLKWQVLPQLILNGQIVSPGDAGEQTKFIFEKIDKILNEAGSKLSDVIRTRMFVTDINDWEKIAIVHGHIFNEIKPVSTLVEVSKLIDKELLIEIEVSAVIQN